MQGYELTERGKIAIAVFLAILLIILAVILALRVWNGSSSPFDNQQRPAETEHVYTPPDVSDTPPPEGSDVDSGDGNQENENGEQGSFDPPQDQTDEPADDPSEEPGDASGEEPSEEPSEGPDDSSEEEPSEEGAPGGQSAPGAASINSAAGTMSFRFSPSSQDSLDASTIEMIGDFIKSPKNTSGAQIVVSIPQLPEEETAKIISAVTDAFAEQGVAQRNLAFTVYRLNTGSNSYEIRLSFSQATTRK